MAQYKTFIDSIYKTITDKTMDDIQKSNIVIDGIQNIMSKSKSNSQSTQTGDSKISCSDFSNTMVKFVCKLDKNKDKLCNIPGSVAWAIGKDKINTIISFITTNPAFVDAVWQRFQTDNDKNEITRLIDSLANKSSATCVQPFFENLMKIIDKSKLSVTLGESRPSSIQSSRPPSIASTTSLTSVGSSLTSGESRPSSTSSLSSVVTDGTDSEEIIPSSSRPSSSGDDKRYGKKFSSSPISILSSPSTFKREPLTEEQKDYKNMWIWTDESQAYNPNNMWRDKEHWEGGKTRRKGINSRKDKKKRKGIKSRKDKKKRKTRSYKK
jgi:hypothetical protein